MFGRTGRATEQGTEAGAATAVELAATGPGLGNKEFLVDRPFLFYVADNVTGAILFQGRVEDPR